MNNILRTTLASAFAVVCIAGSSVAFAADNGGKDADKGNAADKGGQKTNKCADSGDANAADAKANCTTEPNSNAQ